MSKIKYTIRDLMEGKCAVINDGTIDELKTVLKMAFPNDNANILGLCEFYRKNKIDGSKWTCVDTPGELMIPHQSAKDFLNQDAAYKITKEEIFEMSSFCESTKQKLETLFPEVFDDITEITPFQVNTQIIGKMLHIAHSVAPDNMSHKCFGLSQDYSWSLIENNGYQILVPKKIK